MEKTIKIYNSLEEAEKADIEYWRNASYDERFRTLEAIRFLTYKMLNCFFRSKLTTFSAQN